MIFPAERLQEHGYTVVKVPVDGEGGFVDLDFLSEQVDGDTLLVSIAPVNHEVGGVKQDIRAIIELVKDKDEAVKIHCDACDAFCRMPLDMERLGIDLASFSSHKVYGPRESVPCM